MCAMQTSRPDEVKRVGIWVRVSTEDQAKGESPEHHEKRARLYAEAKGWEVVTLYDLSGVSGKSVIEHAECKRMLDDMKSGRITGLVFSKLARLARNTQELLDFADLFREHDADLISLHESIDTSSPAGRLFYTMIAAMAQWEREEISERVAASVPIRAKLGKQTGGRAPFGYQWKDGKLEPDPDEAPVRRLVHKLFVEHKRKKVVARVLNEQGYRTRGGGKFTDTTVSRLLTDPTAKGLHRANYTRSAAGGGKRLKPESDWVYQAVEPVVSEALWNACQQILDEQAKTRKPARKGEYVFSGYTMCACGGKMYIKLPSLKYTCRTCNRKIPMDDLEALFREQLQSFFLSEEEIAEFLSNADASIREQEQLVEHLQAELEKVRGEMDVIYRAYVQGEIAVKEFGRRHRPLEERCEQIEEQIPELQAEIDLKKINHLSRHEIITGARHLYGQWDTLPFEEKRSVVEAITEKIVIGDEEVDIHLHYIPQGITDEVPSESAGQKATNNHGFMAATSWMREG